MRGLKVNPFVFFPAAGVIVLFVTLAALFSDQMEHVFDAVQGFIVAQLGWFYIVCVGFFVVFVLWLMVSKHGALKLGKEDDEPDYNLLTWFAMLFSAGMGIGLLFFSVAEPMMHFDDPPPHVASGTAAVDEMRSLEGEIAELEGSLEAAGGAESAPEVASALAAAEEAHMDARERASNSARDAMTTTFFHWGLHAWAIYIVVGLSLAYFSYRHGLPLTIRSTLWPILGERVHGPIGNTVDVLAIFGTLFGVATSLGLGVMQIGAGIEHLGIFESNQTTQLLLIAGITAVATVSVVSGLDVGIRRLSELNMVAGVILLLFVFLLGPTFVLLSSFVQTTGNYVSELVERTFRTDAMVGTEWQSGWTMFYWGWWISWSPFVGMFVARVSRGRTIREFILGVLFAPTLLGFVWLVVFGNTGISMQINGVADIAGAVSDDLSVAIFVMLEQLPLQAITATLATLVIATYFVTSSDSASLVIDILSSDGDPDPPIPQRVFWAVTEGVVAAVLLVSGGLIALQTAAITTALPFSIIMLVMCWSLVRGLRQERAGLPLAGAALGAPGGPSLPSVEEAAALAEKWGPIMGNGQDWRERLARIAAKGVRHEKPMPVDQSREQINLFIGDVVLPAFEEIKGELEQHGREVDVNRSTYEASLVVRHEGKEEFSYAIRGRAYHKMSFAFPEMAKAGEPMFSRAEVVLKGGRGAEGKMARWTKEGIIRDFLDEYARWVGW